MTEHLNKLAKGGAWWVYDFLASQLVGFGLTVLILTLGIGYKVDDDRVDEAAVVAAKQVGSTSLAAGYRSFSGEIKQAKTAALEAFPVSLRELVVRASLGVGIAALVLGVGLALTRAPSRAHVLRDLGWGIAAPGALAAIAMVVLEWRALKAVRATISGDRPLTEVSHDGRVAVTAVALVLWPALLAGTVAILLAVSARKRHLRQDRGKPFTPLHVASHFLLVLGCVPWLHFVASSLLGAFTEGASTGASLAPWVNAPLVYAACATLFSFGTALFLSARAEAKRIDARSV